NVDGAAASTGRVGKALSLTHDKKQWVKVDGAKNALFDLYDRMTYSIWIYAKRHTVEYQSVFTKGETGFRMHYYGLPEWDDNKGKNIVEICVEAVGGGDLCPLKGGDTAPWKGTDVAPGAWVHWVAVHDHPVL